MTQPPYLKSCYNPKMITIPIEKSAKNKQAIHERRKINQQEAQKKMSKLTQISAKLNKSKTHLKIYL